MNPKCFVESLQGLRFENVFNPYSDRCGECDLEGAPRHRSDALLSILQMATKQEIDSIWIGRDLGYRGGRRTGLALTDDVHIDAHAQRWEISITRPTKGKIVAERTAATVWCSLRQIKAPVFLWNVFPLHPHETKCPFSNRAHNSSERRAGEDVLSELIHLLKPDRLIAIGGDAAHVTCRLFPRRKVVQVRHPSHGGQLQFAEQIHELYSSLFLTAS